jgi:formylglycine-generating enzyme required for sulfatase activity
MNKFIYVPKGSDFDSDKVGGLNFEDLGNGIQLEMVMIPSGSFMMGSPETEEGSMMMNVLSTKSPSKPFVWVNIKSHRHNGRL